MLQLNPWLTQYPAVRLSELNIQPLINVFDAMVDLRIKAMPTHVQLRYPKLGY